MELGNTGSAQHAADALSLPDVRGFYRLQPTKFQRVLPWLQGLLAIGQLLLGIGASFPQPWWSLIWVGMLVIAALQGVSLRRAGTTVDDQGLRVKAGLTAGKLLAWDQVAEVAPRRQFDQAATAVLVSGRRVKLIGLPETAARRLAKPHER